MNCQAVLGLKLVSEVPGYGPCGGEGNQMSFQFLFAGVLGLQQWLLTLSKGVRAEGWGSSPEAQSWRKHVAVLTRLLQRGSQDLVQIFKSCLSCSKYFLK